MEILVVYDIATHTNGGPRRLQRVANACQAYGQRVQYSVFECVINARDLELLTARLRSEIDETTDTIRIYRLREPLNKHLLAIGTIPPFDQRDPLIF